MILVKNKLKRLKRDNEDDASSEASRAKRDMLHYMKYSHLGNIPENDFIIDIKEYKNKATQHPDIRNRSTQTHRMEDKATDTLDDFEKIDYKSGSAVPFRSGRADLGPFRAVPFCRVPRGVGVGLKRCHLRFLRVWKCR